MFSIVFRIALIWSFLGFWNPARAQPMDPATCPDLSEFYAASSEDNANWEVIRLQLAPLLNRCLRNADFFALLGAAQLNTGDVGSALESLERALLLDPENGGAQVDYAQALFVQGQLFSALELNRQIIQRDDVPQNLQPMLQARQQAWQSLTRQSSLQADLLAGYDSNLNGAPSPDQITLTLSGESVVLPLNPEFRPVKGPYLNARVSGRLRQLAPAHQHNATLEMRARVSEDQGSDQLQLNTRYAFIKPGHRQNWQLNAGLSHLNFGGNPLYTATELGGRYFRGQLNGLCQPYTTGAVQHQLFHNQSRQNAIESKLGGGLVCQQETRYGTQQFMPEFNILANTPTNDGRAGDERYGWQFNLDWQLALPNSTLISAQYNYTKMKDQTGYSVLLKDNASRWIRRNYLLIQLRRPLAEDTVLLMNAYRQLQDSNLALFRSSDRTIEIGFSLAF